VKIPAEVKQRLFAALRMTKIAFGLLIGINQIKLAL
jgi:hypothetical protein